MKALFSTLSIALALVLFAGCQPAEEEGNANTENATNGEQAKAAISEDEHADHEGTHDDGNHEGHDAAGSDEHKSALTDVAKSVTSTLKGAALNAALEMASVEAGCGSCTYKLEDAQGCELAIKVGDQAYLVSGADIDAHKAGLCDNPRAAKITGEVKDGEFVSTHFEFVKDEA